MVKSNGSSQFKDTSEPNLVEAGKTMPEKLLPVDKGHKTNPPAKWFEETCLKIDHNQPRITAYQKRTAAMNIWDGMTKAAKATTIKKYGKGCLN